MIFRSEALDMIFLGVLRKGDSATSLLIPFLKEMDSRCFEKNGTQLLTLDYTLPSGRKSRDVQCCQVPSQKQCRVLGFCDLYIIAQKVSENRVSAFLE
jgi:hypothetical protein